MNPKWKRWVELVETEWIECTECKNSWLPDHTPECGCEEE